MLDTLYTIFIAPIEILLSVLFSFTAEIHHSKNVQIILLSLMVSILLIPIYNLFDHWQSKDRVVERAMQPKLEMLKRSFKGQERFAMLKTVYHQFGYHPIYGVRNSLGFLLQIPFFIAAYQYLSLNPALQGVASGPFKNLSAPDGLIHIGDLTLNLLPILMTVINLVSGYIYTRGLMRKDKVQMVLIALVFLVLLYNSPAALVLYWTFNNVFSLVKNLIHRIKSPAKKVERFMAYQHSLPYLATILFLTIAFFYFPSQLVASDPAVFEIENRGWMLIGSYYNALIIGLYLFFVVKYFCYRLTPLIDIAIFILAIFALLTTIYNIYDAGALDHFAFADLAGSLGEIQYRILVDIGIVIAIIALYILVARRFKQMIVGISIAVFLAFSTVTAYSIPEVQSEKTDASGRHYNQFIPRYFTEITTFSTNKKNIFVLMLDGFTNPLFGEIMALDPSLEADFSGFTWYSNTLATGGNTFMGAPAIYGGHRLTPYAINERKDAIKSLESELNQGYRPLLDALGKADYTVDLINAQHASCQEIKAFAPSVRNCTQYAESEDDLNEYFLKAHVDKLPLEIADKAGVNNQTSYLPSIGLFYSTFYSLREFIYDEGTWLSIFNNTASINVPYGYYAFLTSYMDQLRFTETTAPTFKYMNSGFTHANWHFADNSCRLQVVGARYTEGNLDKVNQNQLYTTYCALKEVQKLVQQLKAHNAWDNTMLIFVSDHGFKGDVRLAEAFAGEDGAINFNNYPGRPESFLLVKDFNQNGPLAESRDLMSPADVPSIICQDMGSCNQIQPDPRMNPDPNRKLIYTMGPAHPDRHDKNSYKIDDIWEVTGDMYQRQNWQQLSQ